MELRGIASGASMNTIHRYRRFDGWDYSRGASFFIPAVAALLAAAGQAQSKNG